MTVPAFHQRIIVVGYASNLSGGMTHVTKVLMNNFSNMELHPYKVCYRPKCKALYCYLQSVVTFINKIYVGRHKCNIIILLQIGSPSDLIQSLPFIWLSKLLNCKVCTQYHKSADNLYKSAPLYAIASMVNRSLRLVDVHCFLSKRLKDSFAQMFPYSFNSRTIPNALGEKWISSRVLPWEKRHRDIVFLGRWSWEKGVNDLVKCMDIVKSDVVCEFYSDHIPAEHNKCKFLSWATEAEVMQIIRTAKLLVLPSYAEAYPTVLLEAAACGTPFLASNIAGIPDIVEESQGGRIFEVGDVAGMAWTIDEMMNDVNIWNEMSRNGKGWVNNICEKNVKKLWVDLFNSL